MDQLPCTTFKYANAQQLLKHRVIALPTNLTTGLPYFFNTGSYRSNLQL